MVVCTLCRRLNVYRPRLLYYLLFVIQRQSSPMTRRDRRGHLLFSSKTQRLSIETTLVSFFAIQRQSSPIARKDECDHLPPFGRRLNDFRPLVIIHPFAIQRQPSPMACEDRGGFSLSLSRDYQSPLSHLETNKFDGVRGQ